MACSNTIDFSSARKLKKFRVLRSIISRWAAERGVLVPAIFSSERKFRDCGLGDFNEINGSAKSGARAS